MICFVAVVVLVVHVICTHILLKIDYLAVNGIHFLCFSSCVSIYINECVVVSSRYFLLFCFGLFVCFLFVLCFYHQRADGSAPYYATIRMISATNIEDMHARIVLMYVFHYISLFSSLFRVSFNLACEAPDSAYTTPVMK